jgi:hypothetical protein
MRGCHVAKVGNAEGTGHALAKRLELVPYEDDGRNAPAFQFR